MVSYKMYHHVYGLPNSPLSFLPLQAQLHHQSFTTPPRSWSPSFSTPHSLPDTPSKDIVLDSEPHGSEFEVKSKGASYIVFDIQEWVVWREVYRNGRTKR